MKQINPSKTTVVRLCTYLVLALSPIISQTAMANVAAEVQQTVPSHYNLSLSESSFTKNGKKIPQININGGFPGPNLVFREGQTVSITVSNGLKRPASIHWHGLVIPPKMDGAPGFNGFMTVKSGANFTYSFTPRQTGTYWYHSHNGLLEQEGLYGSIVILPKTIDSGTNPTPDRSYDRDHVVLISDRLPSSAEKGFTEVVGRTMAMDDAHAMFGDLADVKGLQFLINGEESQQPHSYIYSEGETLRLRLINASANSIFDLWLQDLPMTIVAVDGQETKSLTVDELRFQPGQTFDVLIKPSGGKVFPLIAESIDRSAAAVALVAPMAGASFTLPAPRSHTLLNEGDISANFAKSNQGAMEGMEDMEGMEGMHHSTSPDIVQQAKELNGKGWGFADTPEGKVALDETQIESLAPASDLRLPTRTITVNLTGNMAKYSWGMGEFNMKKGIRLAYNERVRINFVNDTLMAHPMHLHGLYMLQDSGYSPTAKVTQLNPYLPLRHTVAVPPGKTVSVIVTGSEVGDWAFHCHLLFHMESGMMSRLTVAPAS
ncbi:MAG: multicopper oxidase domain-containing protein [Candidatus Pacebacteria bacterium]|nr:multicopper oxidase domain-containing protein [Candidatus Paceibacterota bacterium]